MDLETPLKISDSHYVTKTEFHVQVDVLTWKFRFRRSFVPRGLPSWRLVRLALEIDYCCWSKMFEFEMKICSLLVSPPRRS
jgi:hypothetical protein